MTNIKEVVIKYKAEQQRLFEQLEAKTRLLVPLLKDKQLNNVASDLEALLFQLDANKQEFHKTILEAGPGALFQLLGAVLPPLPEQS